MGCADVKKPERNLDFEVSGLFAGVFWVVGIVVFLFLMWLVSRLYIWGFEVLALLQRMAERLEYLEYIVKCIQ